MNAIQRLAWLKAVEGGTSDREIGLLRVAIVLAIHGNSKSGECWLAVDTILEETELKSKSSVGRSLVKLRERGFLDYESTIGGSPKNTNHYKLKFPEGMATETAGGVAPAHPLRGKRGSPADTPYEQKGEPRRTEGGAPAQKRGSPADTRTTELTTELTTEPPLSEKTISDQKNRRSKVEISTDDMAIAREMFETLRANNPGHKEPNLNTWADQVRLMRERDNRTPAQIRDLFAWAQSDSFWQSNILSPTKLRAKWDQLTIKRRNGNGTRTKDTRSSAKRVSDKLNEIAVAADEREKDLI